LPVKNESNPIVINDHQELMDAGFTLLFHPDISAARQFEYVKKG